MRLLHPIPDLLKVFHWTLPARGFHVLMADANRAPVEILEADYAASKLPGASRAWNSMVEDCDREQRYVGAQLTFHYDRKQIILEQTELSKGAGWPIYRSLRLLR